MKLTNNDMSDIIRRVQKAINYIRSLLVGLGFPTHVVVLPKSDELTSETIEAAVCQAEKAMIDPNLSEIYIKLAVILVKMKGGDHSHDDEADAIIKKFYDGMKIRFI